MFIQSDGEYATDKNYNNQIAPVNTWEKLSVNELLKTKMQLTDMYYQLQNNPNSKRMLLSRIQLLESLIVKARNPQS